MPNSRQGFVIPLIIAIIAVLIIGAGVYLTDHKKVEAPAIVGTSDWKTYTNIQYGFSVNYPNITNISSSSIEEGGDQIAFTFSNLPKDFLVDIGTKDEFRAMPVGDECDKKGIQENINGIIFYKGDISILYSGMNGVDLVMHCLQLLKN